MLFCLKTTTNDVAETGISYVVCVNMPGLSNYTESLFPIFTELSRFRFSLSFRDIEELMAKCARAVCFSARQSQ